ncbi:MAG: Fic family protein [Opitutales bacterium]
MISGTYQTQPGGYQAFIPTSLPPDPPLQLSETLLNHLSRADRALGRLDGSIQTLPNPDLFVAMYVRKEAVLSSQIEGTQSSLQDVLAAEARMMSPRRPDDVDEVVNYIAAMDHGLVRLKDLPVSNRLIREIHKVLLKGVRGEHLMPGEFRTRQNWIGPVDCTLAEASFVPPPPSELPRLLGEWEQFLNAESPLPLLIRIGLAHAQFETIHPFLDGNGRVGRLLITFLLCEQKILQKPVLYLSYFFKRHRQAYYDHLQAVRDNGDWSSWLAFFLEGVFEVSQQATDTARQILAVREKHRQIITERFGRAAGNGYRLHEYLFQHPILGVNDAQALLETSYPAANNLVRQFNEEGILQEMTGQQRNRRFLYRDYVDLFHEGTARPDHR